MNSLLSALLNKSSRTFYFFLILPLSLCLLLNLSGCNIDQWDDADDEPYDYYYGDPNSPNADLTIPIGNSIYISWADVSVDFIAVLEDHLVISDFGTTSGFAKVRVELNYGTNRDIVDLFVNSTPDSYNLANGNLYNLQVKNLIYENNNYKLIISFTEYSLGCTL
jgi:hypothetical protein